MLPTGAACSSGPPQLSRLRLSSARSWSRSLEGALVRFDQTLFYFSQQSGWLLLGPPLPVDATLRMRRPESVVPWLTGDCQHCSNQKRLRASSGSFSFRCSVGARLPDQ
ncbi:BQ5605_C002g00990 [Microbotryum silenes-dioicae]|uniref:BQ5605_C002g00990 protein n=1 Tax=Microbotryum silenes-dioicae TaxID=796604 RepID=A0A2X0M202_9BASI|nr:BQ5605_C002g00990 [Microbotryum silenes-dioicae]